MLNVPADSPIVPEVIHKFGDSLYNQFENEYFRELHRYEIDDERWKYLSEKLFQIMWILDAGQTTMVNVWVDKKSRMQKSFGTQLGVYKTEERQMTDEEYKESTRKIMENYRNGRDE